jgi:hypothetical protein
LHTKYAPEKLRVAVCSTPPTDKLSSGSERTLAIARALLDTCETDPSHSFCQRSIPELPTRVIEVGNELQGARLFCSNKSKARYITLSYCWGKGNNLKTTKENLDAHLQVLPLGTLPKTIRDAIKITRGLGMKYLWVDALCIIQDSKEDLSREIAVMGDIYANSTLTIAAEDSKSCTDGILVERDWSSTAILPLDLRIPCRKGQKRPISSCASIMVVPKLIDPKEHERQTILATRGWTLQESILSSKILSFGNSDLRWRCFETSWSESNLYINLVSGRTVNFTIAGNVKDADEKFKVYAAWTSIVRNYTSRQLTNPTDTLMALVGLQNRTGRILEDEPLLGLWRNAFLLPSLLWYCIPERQKDERFRIVCPSWSWASVCCPVRYVSDPLKGITFLAELGSLSLESIQNNVNIGGSIMLTGCILPQDVLHDVNIINTWKDPHFPKDSKHVFLLHLADYRPTKRPSRFWGPEQPYKTMFMLIEKISQSKMHFRRVGLSVFLSFKWKHTCVVKETIELF